MTGFSWGLVLPTLVLAVLGWAVPRALALVWPEGVGPLLALGFVATLLMLLLAAAVFAGLYAIQGAPLGELFRLGPWPGVWHFLRLGLLSALVWAPILVLSAAGLPRRWRTETWERA